MTSARRGVEKGWADKGDRKEVETQEVKEEERGGGVIRRRRTPLKGRPKIFLHQGGHASTGGERRLA